MRIFETLVKTFILSSPQQSCGVFVKNKAHKTHTYRGIVAESAFREGLSQFLPKKFGVTAGYIISQVESDSKKLPHFDVIIYDQLNSPVYWSEDNPGQNINGQSRAIPVEYVLGVIEIKASLTKKAAKNAIEHLAELKPYLNGIDDPHTYPKRYVSSQFFCSVVFFELGRDYKSPAVGTWLRQGGDLRGYIGGVILRPSDQNRGTIRLNYFENEGKRDVPMEIPCGGDLLSSFMAELLAKLTGEPKSRYCFPGLMYS